METEKKSSMKLEEIQEHVVFQGEKWKIFLEVSLTLKHCCEVE